MKTVYGTHRTWDENYWAYAVKNGKVVLVRCETREDAVEEKERMKHSDSTRVGVTNRKISELDMRGHCRQQGWKVTVIR